MKILQISAGLNPDAKRSNSYLDTLPYALAELGHEVTVMHMAEIGRWRDGFHLEFTDGEIKTITVRNSGVYAGLPPGTGSGIARPLRDIVPPEPLRRQMAALVQQIRPDVIHLQNLFGFPINLLHEFRKANTPVVWTEHGYFPICPTVHLFKPPGELCSLKRDELTCSKCCAGSQSYLVFRSLLAYNGWLDRLSPNTPVWWTLSYLRNGVLRVHRAVRQLMGTDAPYRKRYDAMSEAMSKADILHCISGVQAARLQSSVGKLPNLKVLPLVPPTIDHLKSLPRQRKPGDKLRFAVLNVFAGRVDKGWNYLHAVLERLQKERSDFQVDWYAEGASSSNVKFHGRYAQGDLARIAQEADFCVMPSIWFETLGFSGMEMLARGVPLICSNRCGVSEFVQHRKTGFIFDPADEASLHVVFSEVLDTPQLASQMRDAQGEASVKMRSFREHVADMSSMLEQSAAKRKI